MNSSALLRILQLSSPSLPIGAYAYSQGVEPAVHTKLIQNDTEALAWLKLVLNENVALNDMSIIVHAYQAWKKEDKAVLHELSVLSSGIRETAELKQEDKHLALALMRLAEPLEVPFPEAFDRLNSYPMVYARFCQYWKIPLQEALTAFAWSWVENQVAAMIKLVPLGQTQGQKMMLAMDEFILQSVERATSNPYEGIGASLPNLAILSSQHESQYSRLFRS